MNRLGFFFVLFLLSLRLLGVENVKFTHYSSDDGLSQNHVLDIIQDSKGFMWFATWDGLNKFDGKSFRVFKGRPGDPNGFTNNRLNSIQEDAFGHIWILSNDHQVYRFNIETEQFTRLSQRKHASWPVIDQPINDILLLSEKETYLLASNGCYRIILNDDGSMQAPVWMSRENGLLAGDQIRSIHLDAQSGIWFLSNNGLTYCKPGSNRHQHYFYQEENSTAFSVSLQIGDRIAFGTDQGVLWIWVPETESFQSATFQSNAAITGLNRLSDGRVLMSTLGDGLYVLNNQLQRVEHHRVEHQPMLVNNRILSMQVDQFEHVWLEVEAHGVVWYDPENSVFKHFQPKSDEQFSLASVQPNFFVVDDRLSGRVWVHPRLGGFSEFDVATETLRPFYNDPDDPNRLFYNTMHDAVVDSDGNLWLSTRSSGIEKCTFIQNDFDFQLVKSLVRQSGGAEVRTLYEDRFRRLWITTKEGMIELRDSSNQVLGYLDSEGVLVPNPLLTQLSVYDMLEDSKGRFWLACKGAGIVVLEYEEDDLSQCRITRLSELKDLTQRPNSNNFYALLEDTKGRIWAGSYGGGLHLIEEQNGSFEVSHPGKGLEQYPYDNCRHIRYLAQDKQGLIWACTTNGLVAFDGTMSKAASLSFYEYRKDGSDPKSLRTNDVHVLLPDEQGHRWIGTFGGGLNRLDASFRLGQKAEFTAYTQREGMPSDIVLDMAFDHENGMWMLSESSLTRFDRNEGNIEVFNRNFGLGPVTFAESALCVLSNQRLCAGTTNGFYRFDPLGMKPVSKKTVLKFTNLYLFNEIVEVGSEHSPLTQSLENTEALIFSHNQSVFTLEFAALDYRAPENIQYAYRLDPVDQNWINAHKRNSVTYTNLAPGTYVFRVRSTNSEGVWMDNERSIHIEVKPGFWNTGWALFLYLFVGLVIFGAALYFFTTIYKLRTEVVVEQKVSDLKMRFFTDMSHELRTPLTLIGGPVEHVLKDPRLDDEIREELNIVQRNIDRMMRIINQLLDFRKVQDQKMQLAVEEMDIGVLTEKIACNFKANAVERGIDFAVHNQGNGVCVFLDKEKYDTIVYNLLSNAFKFTPGGKKVDVFIQAEADGVVLRISDEGTGISKEKLSRIFERFFTGSEGHVGSGTGIGLNLVKELVDMHGATIQVQSQEGKGTQFELRFQLGSQHFEGRSDVIMLSEPNMTNLVSDERLAAPTESAFELNMEHQPLLLVVEDHAELRQFLSTVLSKRYRVAEASDGQMAWNMMRSLMPDFVISDYMMPGLDGLELTKRIKMDEQTCHIPVIMLTAKTDLESKMLSVQSGVDDFITKPFSSAYLEARIENIFMQRGILQEKFRQDFFSIKNPGSNASNLQSQDAAFLKKLMDFMEENISNSDLTVEMLVSMAGMGRTVFFNKIKGLLGISPIEFIKESRIKRAAQLLETGQYNVSEVSFQIGMNDARYFSKCFKQKYGMTPTEFKNKSIK